MAKMIILAAGLTDVGRLRDHNEDYFRVGQPAGSGIEHVWIVADGLGGLKAGEVASRVATQTVFEELSRPDGVGLGLSDRVVSAIKLANQSILDKQATDGHEGMATTIVAMVAVDRRMVVAHVGDSRAYRLRSGSLQPLTKDHTLTQFLLDAGILKPEAVEDFQYRHVVLNPLGTSAGQLRVDVFEDGIQPGDVLLICSDGLHGIVSDDEIRRVLESESNPELACERLVTLANEAGGPDNITVIVARAVEAAP